MLVSYALAQSQITHGHSLWVIPVILAAILSLTFGAFLEHRESMASLFSPKTWYPMQLHEHSTELPTLCAQMVQWGKSHFGASLCYRE